MNDVGDTATLRAHYGPVSELAAAQGNEPAG